MFSDASCMHGTPEHFTANWLAKFQSFTEPFVTSLVFYMWWNCWVYDICSPMSNVRVERSSNCTHGWYCHDSIASSVHIRELLVQWERRGFIAWIQDRGVVCKATLATTVLILQQVGSGYSMAELKDLGLKLKPFWKKFDVKHPPECVLLAKGFKVQSNC